MEVQIPYSIFFTFLCFLFLIHKLSSSKKSLKTLPPGPRKLPLIGNLHQIGSLPHRSFRDLAIKYGPLMHLHLGQIPHYIVSSPEVAKEVMKTHDMIWANRPTGFASKILAYDSTDIAFSPHGNYWRQLRKICTLELLSLKRVQSFRRIREEEVFAVMKHISEHELGSVVNINKKIYPLTNSIVARAAFGRKTTKKAEDIVPLIMAGVRITGGLSICDVIPSLEFLRVISGSKAKAEKVHKDLDEMLDTVINDHIKKKASGDVAEAEEDLVDVLLRVQQDNDLEIPLTLDNIKAVILDMFVGGTETAATTILWAMTEMITNPETMKKGREEVRSVYGNKGYVDESGLRQLKYVNAVVRETLRLHPPSVLLLPRQNSKVCEINGYEIPIKSTVIINAWAIGRHPEYWNEAEKFKPERFIENSIDFKGTNFEYIPFGAGRRICPGVSFATPVLELIIANLLYHFDWKLPNGENHEDLDMTEIFGAAIRRKNDLCLVPTEYRP